MVSKAKTATIAALATRTRVPRVSQSVSQSYGVKVDQRQNVVDVVKAFDVCRLFVCLRTFFRASPWP